MRKTLALLVSVILVMVSVPAIADGYSDMLAKAENYYATEDYPKAIKEVRGIDPASIQMGALGANFKPVIEWNTDTLIIGTTDGIQAYTFKLH